MHFLSDFFNENLIINKHSSEYIKDAENHPYSLTRYISQNLSRSTVSHKIHTLIPICLNMG